MVRFAGVLVLFFLFISTYGQEKQRPVQPDIPGDIMIDFGWNLMFENPRVLKTRWWPSNHVGLHYMWTKKFNDYFSINPSIGFSFETIAMQKPTNYMLQSDRSYAWDTLAQGNIRSNKIAINYVELPVELRFYPTKTVDGEGLFLGFGGIFGARIGAHTKFKYDYEGTTKKEKLYGNFGLNELRYGIVGRFGVKGFNTFVKYYFPDIWRRGPNGANPKLFTVGLNLTLF